MEGEAPKLGEPVKAAPSLIAIEGGRSIAARDVQAEFAKQTEELSTEYDAMAGFAILVWDDQGQASSIVHFGKRNGFAPILIPGIASNMFTNDVMATE
jgi:hypothetical protein